MALNVGDIAEGKVTDIMNYGAFVKINDDEKGLVHISEVSKDYIEDIHTVLKSGDVVKVKIISKDDNGKMALSIKKAYPNANETKKIDIDNRGKNDLISLDDMLSKFLKDSDERQLNLRRNIDSKRGYSRKHS